MIPIVIRCPPIKRHQSWWSKSILSRWRSIGLEKKPYLHISRSEPELALMRSLKTALDPKGILNPGKIL